MSIEIELPEDAAMFSSKTAALASAFTERYFIERIRKGEIPIVRIGRSVRILRQDLLTFLKEKIEEGSEAKEETTPKPVKHRSRHRTVKKSEA